VVDLYHIELKGIKNYYAGFSAGSLVKVISGLHG